MRISEQVTQLKQDFDDVKRAGYDEGYKKGKAEGGYNPLLYAKTGQNLFYGATFPTDYDLVFEVDGLRVASDRNNISNFAFQSQNLRSAKLINHGDKTIPLIADNMFRECTTLESVDLTEFNRKFSTITYFIADSTKVKAVYGELDLTDVTTYLYWLANASSLEELRIKANSITTSITFQWCQYLSADTIQSIIDGLITITDNTPRTLTLHADVRAKLTSEQVNTIKNVKGWSLIPE